VWLVTGDDTGHPGASRFVDELRRDNDENPAFVFYGQEDVGLSARCPRCGGVLLKRSGPNGDFVGCSNYPFCDKTYSDVRILEDKRKCPVCGGWLTRRTRRDGDGEFYGCTNWPEYCQFAMDLNEARGGGPASRVNVEYQRPRRPEPGTNVEYQRFRSQPQSRSKGAQRSGIGVEYQQVQKSQVQKSLRDGRGRNDAPRCPKCGARMLLKRGPYGRFYGCSRFPSCKGTRNYRD
jgi:ssDNA-binding Zn-finger/Zn-ribbon topoisomerase 1